MTPPTELWTVVAPSGITATFGTEGEARAHVSSFDPDVRERLEVARYVRADPSDSTRLAHG